MITLCITNLGKYNEGELIYKELRVPFTDGELEEVLEDIGINEEYEEYFISDYWGGLNIDIGEYYPINELNYQIEDIFSLTNSIDLVNGIIYNYTDDLEEIASILREGNYSTLDGVASLQDLGITIAYELYNVDMEDYISNYIDYEKLAHESGYFIIDGNMALEVY